jgi:deoxyribonuclease IV
MVLGAHCSTAGGLSRALERAESIGASSCQIFVKNNMQWFGKPYAPADVDRYRAQHARSNLKYVFGHAGYLINLAAAPSDNRDKSIKSLIQEVQLATTIDLPFLVLHPGAHLGDGEDTGVERVVEALDEVFRITKASSVRIALENTAGQGSCLGCELKHLAAIIDKVDRPERLGVCLDTAHFLAAGYEIRQPKGWEAAMAELDRLIGLKQILAFHLNDSKTELGSRVDRHAHIGQGKIGLEAFRYILNDARFERHPGCLETPKSDGLHEDIENLRVLRSLVEQREGGPRVKRRLPSDKPPSKPPTTPKQKKSKRP